MKTTPYTLEASIGKCSDSYFMDAFFPYGRDLMLSIDLHIAKCISPKSNAFGMGSSMLTWNPNETGLKWMFGETTISYVKICSISIG